MIKVLIADDHAVVRKGLVGIIEEEPDMKVIAEAANGFEALSQIQAREWDLVILDMSMPGKSGLDVLKEIKQLKPKVPVLILSIHSEDQYAARVLKAGGSGYLTKDSAPEELVKAMRKVLAGGKYLSLNLAEKLVGALSDPDLPPHERLSDREFQVLCLIASGHTVGAVAQECCLSVKTISTYRTRILEKMGLKNNAELTRYALEKGLV